MTGALRLAGILATTVMSIINICWFLDGDGLVFLIVAVAYSTWGAVAIAGLESR